MRCETPIGSNLQGPATVDKRNQELACPHCDRIFKQSGRLNDHIKKQHSDAEGASTSNGAAAPAGEQSVSAAAPKAVAPSPAPSAPSAPMAAPASKPAPRIMDVGSKGGAYDYKSPKLLLQEMLMRDKAPKARYKALPSADGGSWRCKASFWHRCAMLP